MWNNLNFLRGIGALMIVIHHANSEAIPYLSKAPGVVGFIISSIKNLGWSGIDLFFVLGGFLMANTFYQHFDKYGLISIKSYCKARAKRIIPSYYFLLLVLAITGATGWINFSSWHVAVKDSLIHLLFINNYLDQLPNGPTWYLAATVQIYLFMPLIIMLLVRITGKPIDVIVQKGVIIGIVIVPILRCITVLKGSHQPNDFMLTHYRVDTVLMGMLAFSLLRNKNSLVTKIKNHPYVAICLSVLFIIPSIFLPRGNPYMFTIGFSFLALGYSMLVLLLVQRDFILPKVLSITLLALSTWSYNIYLWHYFVPRIIGQPYKDSQLLIHSIINSASLEAIVQISMFAVIGIIVGFAMTNMVEKPMARRMA